MKAKVIMVGDTPNRDARDNPGYLEYWHKVLRIGSVLLITALLSALAIIASACSSPVSLNRSGQNQNAGQIVTVVINDYTTGAPVLGVVTDRNLRVVALESGGAAERAGIMRGDVLKMLEGAPLTTGLDAMARFREKAITGKNLRIGLSRGGNVLQVQVLPLPPARRVSQPTPTAVPVDEFYF